MKTTLVTGADGFIGSHLAEVLVREGFKRGLVETIEWFAQNDNLRSYKADIYNI